MKRKFIFNIILLLTFAMILFPISEKKHGAEAASENLDLRNSYEFKEKSGIFWFIVKDDQGQDKETYCEVSFVPSISNSSIPFYIAEALGQESIFTIRDGDVDQEAEIKRSSIKIGKPDLVGIGDSKILFSPEYDNDTGIHLSYDIIFQQDFYSKKNPGDKYTLEHKVTVYDSPFLGVEVDYEGKTSLHYHRYWAANVDENIWDSNVTVNVVRKSDESYDEPAVGVPTKIFFYWGDSKKPHCVFKPSGSWQSTDDNGEAKFQVGGGGAKIERRVEVGAPALYAKLSKSLGTSIPAQYYTYPDLKSFQGIIKVKVVNIAGEPLEGRIINFWGGSEYIYSGSGKTDESGNAEIRFPGSDYTLTNQMELTMTELPTLELKWNLTQVIDNPNHIVKGHNAPLYLSPEINVEAGYFTYPTNLYEQVKDVKLQVYDVDNPEKILFETTSRAYKEKDGYDSLRDIIIKGAHRAYIEIKPEDLEKTHFGIRAIVPNTDRGIREEFVMKGSVEDPHFNSRELHEPKKEFVFSFYPLRVGAWENGASISYGSLSAQQEFIRKIFPAPVKFKTESPLFVAKAMFSTHSMHLSRIFRELDRMHVIFPGQQDLCIGITPPGFLGAAGLQNAGFLGMNWDFFGAVKGTVLIDPSQTVPHTTLHEFIHTLGFDDVYRSGDYIPISANGHDGTTPINNLPGYIQSCEAIMYDHARSPWPTENEYNALLNYATQPIAKGTKMSTFAMNTATEGQVLLLSGAIEDIKSNERKIYLDPIVKYNGSVDANGDYVNNDYLIQTVDAEGKVLSEHFFSELDYVSNGKGYATFRTSLPAENVQAIEIWQQEYSRRNQMLKRYEYSANPPVVNVNWPDTSTELSGDFTLTWTGVDTDGDNLIAAVQVSSDNGASWTTIAADLPHQANGTCSYKINTANLSLSGKCKFKVVVSDGMYSTEAVSEEYQLADYEEKSKLKLSKTEITIQVKPGTDTITAYLELGNQGRGELEVEFSIQDPSSTIISPLFRKEYTIFSGQNRLLAIPLLLPGEGTVDLTETINLKTNDPEHLETSFIINVEYLGDGADIKPELVSYSVSPAGFSVWERGDDLQLTFKAYVAGSQKDLEGTIVIEDDRGAEILRETMDEDYQQQGGFIYYWQPEEAENLALGNYHVYFGLKNTETNAERIYDTPDFTFSIEKAIQPPHFVEPNVYETNLGVIEKEKQLVIPYEIEYEPIDDSDSLDIRVHSSLTGLEPIEDTTTPGRITGNIKGTANESGSHSIYLIATDSRGNVAQVMFNIVVGVGDLNIYTITLEADGEKGRVYGGGLYNPGEYVMAKAEPEEFYQFINWTDEQGEIVSTEETYEFKASGDRKLVANFEELQVYNYEITDEGVNITKYVGDFKDVDIPNKIEGKPVRSIDHIAFYMKYIESIVFPDTLVSIGENSFSHNKLTEIIIPNNVTEIGAYAFANNNLTEIIIPNNVAEIGAYAFVNNSDLARVVIPGPGVNLGEEVFYGCSPELVIYGVPGSKVNNYAEENNILFKDINENEGGIPAPKYPITITDVTGGRATVESNPADSAAEGATVTVNIDGIQNDQQVKSISVIGENDNGIDLTEEIKDKQYSFIMPAGPVMVKLVLESVPDEELQTYNVFLDAGTGASGTGKYAKDDRVTINAGTRAGYTFNGWVSEDVIFADAKSKTTTFTMPAKDVIIMATWQAISQGGSSSGSSGGKEDSSALEYSIINKNQSAQENGGKIIISNQQAKAGETVLFTIELEPGYENKLLTVLDQNNGLVPVTENDDGTYSFQMPPGEVDITTEFAKIDYFDDVKQEDWYHEAAWFCAAHGIMKGTGEQQFAGHVDTSRAMLVFVLYQLAQGEELTENIFTDVKEGSWYTKAVNWAVKNNIVSGYGDGKFGPNDILTREQMVTILYKYSKLMEHDVNKRDDLGAYQDLESISDWAVTGMEWAVGNDIIKGVGNDLVSPRTGAKRAQFAVIMQRYYMDFVEKN